VTNPEAAWAEKEALEKWWNRHKFELKQAVTKAAKDEVLKLEEAINSSRESSIGLLTQISELERELATTKEALEAAGYGLAEAATKIKQLKEQANNDARVVVREEQELRAAWSEVARLKKMVAKLEVMKGVQWRQKSVHYGPDPVPVDIKDDTEK